jgi:hypothetical protein
LAKINEPKYSLTFVRSSQKGAAAASKEQRASPLLRAGKTEETLPDLEELKKGQAIGKY